MDHQTHIAIQQKSFEPAEEYAQLEADTPEIGAICTFVGLARSFGDRPDVTGLYLEHYPGMTENSIAALIRQARERWKLDAVRVVHRVGVINLGERIVFVGASSAHRADAFAACEFLMDYLKTQAPFWKKERTTAGEHWVEQKASDRERARRWDTQEDS
ncbi:molybdopterin synthase catalytic subunit MoaE [Marinobacteraceae bacterium S3BR75-40.1]